MNKSILVIPDAQVKPGVPLEHLRWLGNYIVQKRPDVIVNIGDFADMASLSSYDVGKKSFEGRRYTSDIESAKQGMRTLMQPLWNLQERQISSKHRVYRPEMHLTLGNHENRIERAINNDSKLEGLISTKDLDYESFGWQVHPFLQVVTLQGINFSHYFVTGLAGRPASTANAQLNKSHASCISGHQQGLQIATGKCADGRLLTSIIAGSFYLHTEDYLGAQGNAHWRGALMLHGCENGSFDLNLLPMRYLQEKYDF